MALDTKRAVEIAASPDMVNVTYNNQPIYIKSVNESRQIANIHPLNRPNEAQVVPLDKLTES